MQRVVVRSLFGVSKSDLCGVAREDVIKKEGLPGLGCRDRARTSAAAVLVVMLVTY